MNEKVKQQAVEVLKNILKAFHEKRYKDVLLYVDESKISDLEEYLLIAIQGTLDLNNLDVIDDYGIPCNFNPPYEYSQLEFYEYNDNSGFVLEYAMTSNGDLVDLQLQLEFLYKGKDGVKAVFKNVDPQ